MRFYEFNIEEAAIDVSSVVQEADTALTKLFFDIVKETARSSIFSFDYEQKQKDKSYTPDTIEKSEKGSLIIFWLEDKVFKEQKSSSAYTCIYKASDVLSKIMQDFLRKNYGVSLNQDGKNDGVIIDQQYYPIENVKAHVLHAHGGGVPADAGGHMTRREPPVSMGVFDSSKVNKNYPQYAGIKIYVHNMGSFRQDFESAVLNEVSIELRNEVIDYETMYFIDNMVEQVINTFAHEFDHVLFYIKKSKKTANLSSTSYFKNDKKTHGYNNHTDFANPQDFERYLGSHIELQAWASTEASELIRQSVLVQRRDYSNHKIPGRDINDPKIWNQEIDKLIAQVKASNKKYSTHSYEYQDRIRKMIDQDGGDQLAYRKTWQKYLQLLVAKLEAYKK